MSGRLVGEVINWLQTPAATGLTLAERAVLMVIAERANDDTRDMWRYRADDTTLFERIQFACDLEPSGLSKVFQKLRKRGLEVRVQIATGKDGRPIFAHKGIAMKFRLPHFPASVILPETPDRADEHPPSGPVDNSADDPHDDPDRADTDPPYGPKGRTGSPHRADTRPPLRRKAPYRANPYEETSGLSRSGAEVEDSARPPAEPSATDDLDSMDEARDYRKATAILHTLPDLGSQFMAAARDESPDAGMRQLVIRAAQLAKGGIPA